MKTRKTPTMMGKKVFSGIYLPLILFCIGFLPAQSKAQDAANSVYVELLGSGMLYSINYDRLITPNLAGRIGLMYLSVDGVSTDPEDPAVEVTMKLVPITGSYLFGASNHKLELGAGLTWIFVSADVDGISGVTGSGFGTWNGILGYRYQPSDGGFNFRIGYTPHLGREYDTDSTTGDLKKVWTYIHWGGLSLGYTF